jgi:hypothetical protein
MATLGVFVEELRALGWVEGQNIRFERRSDEGRPNRRPEIFKELVRLPVDVLVTLSNTMARAALGATRFGGATRPLPRRLTLRRFRAGA